MECSHEVTNLKTEGSVSHYKILQEIIIPLAIHGTYFANFHTHQKDNSFLWGVGKLKVKAVINCKKGLHEKLVV
jgi:hypothetical protein